MRWSLCVIIPVTAYWDSSTPNHLQAMKIRTSTCLIIHRGNGNCWWNTGRVSSHSNVVMNIVANNMLWAALPLARQDFVPHFLVAGSFLKAKEMTVGTLDSKGTVSKLGKKGRDLRSQGSKISTPILLGYISMKWYLSNVAQFHWCQGKFSFQG